MHPVPGLGGRSAGHSPKLFMCFSFGPCPGGTTCDLAQRSALFAAVGGASSVGAGLGLVPGFKPAF